MVKKAKTGRPKLYPAGTQRISVYLPADAVAEFVRVHERKLRAADVTKAFVEKYLT